MGEVRHLDANDLWIQEMTENNRSNYHKAIGIQNPAGLMTEELAANDIETCTQGTSPCFAEWRPSSAARIAFDEGNVATTTSWMTGVTIWRAWVSSK